MDTLICVQCGETWPRKPTKKSLDAMDKHKDHGVRVAPRERGIVLQQHEVRAILDGRQTQLRRVVKRLPSERTDMTTAVIRVCVMTSLFTRHDEHGNCHNCKGGVVCPFGDIGDRLWVKETFSTSALSVYPCPRAWYRATDVHTKWDDPATMDMHESGCGGRSANCFLCVADREGKFRWRPSIHMPRWASRITLEITDVRVQRLQDISEEDAKAEGATRREFTYRDGPRGRGRHGSGWSCDWSITFKRI